LDVFAGFTMLSMAYLNLQVPQMYTMPLMLFALGAPIISSSVVAEKNLPTNITLKHKGKRLSRLDGPESGMYVKVLVRTSIAKGFEIFIFSFKFLRV